MTSQRVKIIVNPNANLGRAWEMAADLRPIVDEYGGADWAGSVYPGHSIELAREAGELGYDMVIAAGGDGTTHEVVNGLMQIPKERRPKLGVIPLGSGNDFTHMIGVDKRPAYALRQVLSGNPKLIDVVRFWDGNGRNEYFVNTLGIGFDATVTIRSRKNKVFRGFMIYLVAVLQTILFNHEAPRMKIKTDREEIETEMIMIVLCNGGREGGGFIVSSVAKPDDGLLHYTAVKKVSRPMMMRLVPEFMKGTYHRFQQVQTGDFVRLELESDRPLTIHADGEIFAGWGTNIRKIGAEIFPKGLIVNV